MTSDQGIGVMHSSERQLSNQRLTHVMATRVRDDITIFTNDRDQLLRSIEANPGEKASALEYTGEKSMSHTSKRPAPAPAPPQTPSIAPTTPDTAVPSPSPPEPARSAPTRKIPEKTIELGL